jgi:hypothetical protein
MEVVGQILNRGMVPRVSIRGRPRLWSAIGVHGFNPGFVGAFVVHLNRPFYLNIFDNQEPPCLIVSANLAAGTWRRSELLLLLMAAESPISFASWQSLLDNFAIHEAVFTGREIGILQSTS